MQSKLILLKHFMSTGQWEAALKVASRFPRLGEHACAIVTAIGSLPIRVGRQFTTSRKLGKTHQNVLVFVKGDPRLATQACGKIEIDKLAFNAYLPP